jgi:formylglycine-generating enzyme required for sulfatase activity
MLEPMMKMMVGQQIGSYRLNKFLGAGSFGGVFHASEMVRNTSVQEVAVKVIPESSDDKLIELQNARKLNHANLVQSYSVGEFNFMNTEMLYLVMELAQDSLENHIEKGSLSSGEVKNITTQVAQGLNYLHSQNKVHRDLKPGNILKVNQQYKLADFGLIRTLNSEKSYTATVHTSGTILYMPPEAFKREVSPAWDMWSLGIMLIQMTTNKYPYRYDDINQLMARVIQCELEIPSLPKEFKPIIEGCLQKERSQRWTAQQVLNALQPVGQASSLSSQKIQTSSPSSNKMQTSSLSQSEQTTGRMPVPPSPPSSPPPNSGKMPVLIKENLGNGIILELVKIPAGEFMMGSNNGRNNEKPVHKVKLKEFYMGKYPVTEAQYQAIMRKNPLPSKADDKPVVCVNWDMAQEFCQKLSEKTGKKYKLPSEAQWEYACRAGSTGKWCFGDDENQLKDYAWYGSWNIFAGGGHQVGQKKPNKWGLYDMHGNVWEWCEDDCADNYQNTPIDGTSYTNKSMNYKCLRGGSWLCVSDLCRCAFRFGNSRDNRDDGNGFRVALAFSSIT